MKRILDNYNKALHVTLNLFQGLIVKMLKQVQHDNLIYGLSALIILAGVSAHKAQGLEAAETPLKIGAGVFIKVIPQKEINTLTADIGDEVSFICPKNMYIYETKAVPEDTVFYGTVEDLKEPAEGRDAAIKIEINKMAAPDGRVYSVKGHIYSSNNNYLGGGRTSNTYYHRVYNHSRGFRPFLQAVPLNVFDTGSHVIIRTGTEYFIIIENDIILR